MIPRVGICETGPSTCAQTIREILVCVRCSLLSNHGDCATETGGLYRLGDAPVGLRAWYQLLLTADRGVDICDLVVIHVVYRRMDQVVVLWDWLIWRSHGVTRVGSRVVGHLAGSVASRVVCTVRRVCRGPTGKCTHTCEYQH